MFHTIASPFRLKLHLQLFAADGGGDGGGGGDGSNGGGAGGGEKIFTQAELDQHVQTRVARAEKAAQKTLAKELGYDSVEAMHAALKKPEGGNGKGGEGSSLTMDDVEKRAKELLASSQKEQSEKTFQRLLRAEVKVLANELGFADWEDANALADLSKVKEDDKGNLVGVKEALEELLKKKPHLGKQKPGGGSFGATVGGGTGGGDDKARQEALIKQAQTRGVLPTNQTAYNPWGK